MNTLQECYEQAGSVFPFEIKWELDCDVYRIIRKDGTNWDTQPGTFFRGHNNREFELVSQGAATPQHEAIAAAVHMTPVEEKECTCTYTAGGPSLDNDCPYHKDKKPK